MAAGGSEPVMVDDQVDDRAGEDVFLPPSPPCEQPASAGSHARAASSTAPRRCPRMVLNLCKTVGVMERFDFASVVGPDAPPLAQSVSHSGVLP